MCNVYNVYVYNIILLICDCVQVSLINLLYEYNIWIQLLSIKIMEKPIGF